jgi:hypothetical protein
MALLGEEDLYPTKAQYFAPLNKAITAAEKWIAVQPAGEK